MSRSSLAMEVSRLIFKAEPKLLAADPEAAATAIMALADVMGCAASFVLEKKGEQNYLGMMRIVMRAVDEGARKTQEKAHHIAAHEPAGSVQ